MNQTHRSALASSNSKMMMSLSRNAIFRGIALRPIKRQLRQDCLLTTPFTRNFSTSQINPNITTNENKVENVDVLIVGGGVVGATLARLINERSPSCKVGIIDRAAPNLNLNLNGSNQRPEVPQARAYALSPRSLDLIGPSVLEKLQLGVYETMQVWEQDSPSTLLFSNQDLPEETFDFSRGLGAVVEDTPLVQALWEQITQSSNTQCWAPATIQSIETNVDQTKGTGVVVKILHGDNGDHTGEGEDKDTATKSATTTSIHANLLVAADGANSFVRNATQMPWKGWDYGRKAVTFCVKLDKEMPPRAFQRFLPDGPVALLPTWSPHHATIVWSTTPSHAQALQNLPEHELVKEINATLQHGPQRSPPLVPEHIHQLLRSSGISPLSSAISGVERLVETANYGLTMSHWTEMDNKFMAPPTVAVSGIEGPRSAFDLKCFYAPTVAENRVALVGDAAHTVHPMAGQGLNLGLYDAHVLSEQIQKAVDSGMDVGHSLFLDEYQNNRQLHVGLAMAGIHTLHEMFRVRSAPFMTLKSLGMNITHHVGPLRRQLAAAAAGVY